MFKKVVQEELRVPANIDYLADMRDFVMRLGRRYGVSERVINAFKLAIDEAATNIIRHAYRDWEGFITLRMVIRNKSVSVSIIDQGHTFDLRQVNDPDLQRYMDIGKKGGLGIFIIRRVMDDIDYRKTEEGNELRLTKVRDVSPRRFMVPNLSVTMKTRFSLVASGILSAVILFFGGWTLIRQDKLVKESHWEAGQTLANNLALQCQDYLARGDFLEITTLVSEFLRDYSPLMADAFVLDTANTIQGTIDTNLLFKPYRVPTEAHVYRPYLKAYYDRHLNKQVYDIICDVSVIVETRHHRLGEVHFLLDTNYIHKQVHAAQLKVLVITFFTFILGNIFIFILVYLAMSPFKKLARWVRELGQGEVKNEMEFDGSDEIGEIAQAFNDITEKFRKSQENLAEQERLQKEMQVAQEIQQTLLPASFPEIEGYELASYYEAAKEVGGDYFDFVQVDKDTLGIVVADVSGKGVPGSLIMTMIRTALRTEARGNKNAADVLARVNDFVMNDMKRGMFVTVFYIILDSQTRTISYASAGHNPMILYRGSSKKSYYLNPRGFPIGISLPEKDLFRKSIQSDTLKLQADDVLIVYTDGVTEAMNPNRDQFGDERFLSVIRKYGDLKVEPLTGQIRQELAAFTGGFPQNDDITLVAIREKLNVEDVLFDMRVRLLKMVEEGKSVKEACKEVGVSTSTYYKYQKRYKKHGEEGLKETVFRSDIEDRHFSIEDKAKLLDIVQKYPEYGAKRISEELNTEVYEFTQIDEKRIYNELVRSRLNTKERRAAFAQRGSKGKRLKPPGTPFMTLDGEILMGEKLEEKLKEEQTTADTNRKIKYREVTPEKEEETESKPKPAMEEDSPLVQDDLLLEESAFEPASESGESKEAKPEVGPRLDDEMAFFDDSLLLSEFGESEEDTVQDTFEDTETDPFPESEDEVTEENEEPEEQIVSDEFKDDIFESLMMDELSIDDEEDFSENSGKSLEDIIHQDEGSKVSEESIDQIDDHITDSVAKELFEEDIDETMQGFPDEMSPEPEDDFLDLMEDVGFDRREVLAGRSSQEIYGPAEVDPSGHSKKYVESGLWFYRQGQYSRAVEDFWKAIEKNPNMAEAHQCLGDTFFRMGQLEKAREAYERVRSLDPDNINVLENLGVIFANRGDYKKAVWQWGEVLKKNPDRHDIVDRIKRMQKVIRQRAI